MAVLVLSCIIHCSHLYLTCDLYLQFQTKQQGSINVDGGPRIVSAWTCCFIMYHSLFLPVSYLWLVFVVSDLHCSLVPSVSYLYRHSCASFVLHHSLILPVSYLYRHCCDSFVLHCSLVLAVSYLCRHSCASFVLHCSLVPVVSYLYRHGSARFVLHFSLVPSVSYLCRHGCAFSVTWCLLFLSVSYLWFVPAVSDQTTGQHQCRWGTQDSVWRFQHRYGCARSVKHLSGRNQTQLGRSKIPGKQWDFSSLRWWESDSA